MCLYFSIGNGQPTEPALCRLYRHCAGCIGTLSFPMPLLNWYCPHSIYRNGTVSVRLSVRLSHSPAAAARCGFAAVGPVGRKYRSIAAPTTCGGQMRT